jgi:hypothetical protein
MKRLLVMFLLLIGLSVVQAAYYAPRLPDRVASHFNASGQPDGWMDRAPFLVLSVVMPAGVAGVFAMIELISHALALSSIRKAENSGQGPGGELQARRCEAGRAAIPHVSDFMFWAGTATMILLIATMHLAIRANLATPPVLRHMWPVMIGFFLLVAALGIRLVVQLRETTRGLPPPEIPPGIWFPAKRFGWGWGLPCCWQGWVVMIGWIAAFIAGLVLILRGEPTAGRAVLVLPFLVGMAGLLIAICWAKGEKPRWRWGD